MNISKIWKLIKEKRYEKRAHRESFFRCERYSQNRTTGLRPWKCNSSVSYTNLCAIYSITITDNWYMRHLPFQGKVKIGLRPFFPNPPKSKYPAASLMLRGSFFYSFSTKSSISKGWFTKCFPPLALRKVSGRKPQVTERQGRWEFLAVSMSTSVSPT